MDELLFALVVGLAACGETSPQADLSITIDPAVKHQKMDGFGGTLTTFEDTGIFNRHDPSQPVNTSATAAQKQMIAAQLYGQIGLSRTRLFPTGFEPANDNSDPLTLNPSAFSWAGVDAQIDWVAQARPSGLATFFSSLDLNSGGMASAWLRLSGDACALDTTKLDEYVEYQIAMARHFRDLGAELPFLTINNEPDFCEVPSASSAFINPLHYVEAVKRLGQRLRQDNLTAKIVVTDGVSPGSSLPYARAALEDMAARGYIGALAYHSYDGYQNLSVLRESAAGKPTGQDVRGEFRALAGQYSLPLWMTEVCYCTTQAEGGVTLSDFELGRLRINHLLDELLFTEVTAFDVMNAFFIGRPGVRDELVEVAFNSDGTLKSADIAMYGRMIGHFAQAATPGSTRIDAKATDARIRVIAFARSDGKTTIVLVNNATVALRAAVAGSWTTLTTIENDAWRAGSASGSVTLPPSSLVTLISS